MEKKQQKYFIHIFAVELVVYGNKSIIMNQIGA